MRFLISSNPENLTKALADYTKTATVEAEYGDVVVEGSEATLAHHGKNAGNPAPCLFPNMDTSGIEVVGLSHLDLDALGGCLAILGQKHDAPSFWSLAAFVDTSGPHKLPVSGASDEDRLALNAFWAWAQGNKVFAPRDGSVDDVTDKVMAAAEALDRILAGDEDMLQAGADFAAQGDELGESSFVEEVGGVVVRVASAFTNHLYGPEGKAVVALSPRLGSITVSLADAIPGVSCKDVVQKLWGPEAGGHAGIAGSPRDKRMGLDDLVAARDAMVQALAKSFSS